MHLNITMIYLACAVAWTVIETNLTLARLENDDKHWLTRAMRMVRDWAKKQNTAISVSSRVLACFILALAAWIPILLASALWPATVLIYVIANYRNED